jgi:hypothetical protein
MIYSLVFAAILASVYLLGRIRKMDLLPEMIIGFTIGLSWEVYSANEWVYDPSKLTMLNLWISTIPFEIVVAWGASLAATILAVNEIMKRFKTTSKLSFLLSGWIILFVFGALIEIIGYYNGFWGYTVKSDLWLWPTAIPLRIMLGWVTLGTCYLASIMFYRDTVKKGFSLLRIRRQHAEYNSPKMPETESEHNKVV